MQLGIIKITLKKYSLLEIIYTSRYCIHIDTPSDKYHNKIFSFACLTLVQLQTPPTSRSHRSSGLNKRSTTATKPTGLTGAAVKSTENSKRCVYGRQLQDKQQIFLMNLTGF